MRFVPGFVLLVMAFIINPAPVHAGGLVFNGFYCPQKLPCDASDPSFPAQQSLIAAVSSCVSAHMATKPSEALFDSSLDNSGCLTTNANAFQPAGNFNPLPQCCIQSVPEGGCMVHCKVLE